MDCYPYVASSTVLLPARVAVSSDVRITWSSVEPEAAGRSLFTMAAERGIEPTALAAQLVPGGANYFAMSDEDVDRILAHPLVMIGSDGRPHDPVPHPRLWGTFPRVLGHYVRQRRLLALEAAVHKMTGLTARRFSLAARGERRVGAAADVTLAYLAFCKSHPHHAELMFGALARTKPGNLEAKALEAFGSLVRLTEDALREQQSSVERNARAVALALWAQTHGFSVLATHVDFSALAPDVPPERVVRDVLEDSVKSLLQSPG